MPSDLVGGFRLQEHLGSGGMGQVFRCTHATTGEVAAIKFLRDDRLDSAEVAERFEREIALLADLKHPNIVHLLAEGTHEGRRYCVMQLVAQGSLAELLERHKHVAVPFAVRTARQLLAALAHAHGRRHVHRDIKPSNVRYDLSGNAMLIDFGLAKAMDEARPLTADGTLLGTLAYMAPEQVRGEAATPASDLYQLGAMLYEMLTGELPHDGGDVLRALATGHGKPPVPAHQRNPQVPATLDNVLAKLLALDPDARPRTAEEAAELLLEAVPRTGKTGPHAVVRATPDPMHRVPALPPENWREAARNAVGFHVRQVRASREVRTALASSLAAAIVIVVGLRLELPGAAGPGLRGCELAAKAETTDVVVQATEACHAFLELAGKGERAIVLFNRKPATKIAFRGLPVLPGRTYQARIWLSREPHFPADAPAGAVRTFRALSPPLPAPPPSFASRAGPAPDEPAASRARAAGLLVAGMKVRVGRFTAPETPTTRENFENRLMLLQNAQSRIAGELASGSLRFPDDEPDQLRRMFRTDANQACERLDIDLAFLASAAD